jgi:pimeloyl-ACP methyl ester carboxylesterase
MPHPSPAAPAPEMPRALYELPVPGPVEIEHGFASVDGLRLHYAAAGQGEALVLLHGWPQHWWSWRALIGPLAEHYRVICPDVRGLGWSAGGSADHSLGRLAADVVDLLDQLEIESACLVGHDWGAAIGYQACLDRPGRFRAFMPIGGLTPWSSEGASLRLWARPWHIPILAAGGRSPRLTRRIAANSLRAWRGEGAFSSSELDVYLDSVATPESAAATQRYYRTVALTEIPRFVRHHSEMLLSTPTLHLNGELDPLTIGVPDSYRRYAGRMRLELLAGCGHFIAEEAPEQLLGRIESFFEETREEGSP